MRGIRLELLPHECEAILKWGATPAVQQQLETRTAKDSIAIITINPVDLNWISSDLTHAIVKRNCTDNTLFELAERLEYVLETGDGSLDAW